MISPISWMARHPVAANLLMVFLIFAGLASLLTIPSKVFPEFSLDSVSVTVAYPGASPREIETSIIKRIEEQVEAIDEISELTAVASEGLGRVTLELARGADVSEKLDEVKSEIDRITTFPTEAEEPEVSAVTNRSRTIEIAVYGDASETVLKELANQIKDDLTREPSISFVEVGATRDYEVSIEVSNDTLRAYGLSLTQIASIVRQESLDLPGGDLTTQTDTILVRTVGQNYDRSDFEDIVILSTEAGTTVRLGDIATVRDGFAQSDLISRFNGQPVAFVKVFRVGDEKVLDIVATVERYLADVLEPSLPPGLDYSIWRNDAEELKNRLSLLMKNGIIGLLLVMAALSLFLDLRLAFWVAIGIGVSFIATFAVMSLLGLSINQISLFAFILAIGIVVDDAIVVGENIFAQNEQGTSGEEAAVAGAHRVAVPVLFAVSTTVAAFLPLLFLPGTLGKFLWVVPAVVITVLMFSLIESMLILPRHLSHLNLNQPPRNPLVKTMNGVRHRVDAGLQAFTEGPLERALRFTVNHWGVVLSLGLAAIILTIGLIAGGYVRFVFFPAIEGRYVTAAIELEEGAPVEKSFEVAERIAVIGDRLAAEFTDTYAEDGTPISTATYILAGASEGSSGPDGPGSSVDVSHQASVVMELIDPEDRTFSARQFEAAWREATGEIPGVQKLSFSANLVQIGEPVQLELSAGSEDELTTAIDRVKEALSGLQGVSDIESDRSRGKVELQLSLKPEARAFGLTLETLAAQVRGAFFGAEALRVQRGREEVRVYVRLPEAERDSLDDLSDYRIRTDDGRFLPLSAVATVRETLSPTSINRRAGREIVTITASVNEAVITGQEATDFLRANVLPQLTADFQSLEVSFGGQQRDQGEALPALARNFILALFAIYVLLALPFASYTQPLVVMAAIPFGLIGAVLGHMVMGLSLTLLSIFGIVGLSGVVINNALVLIDFTNEERRRGKALDEALVEAAKGRFRPILLTAITTFLGTFPLIVEQSVQAQFLIPLAVSLGFGVLIGTLILMFLIPALAMLEGSLFGGATKSSVQKRTA